MIAGVLLAAGSARRFDGSQKLLAPVPYDGGSVPLVRLASLGLVEAGVDRIAVVTGHDASKVRDALAGLDVRFVLNAGYAAGMSGSLRAGVEEVKRQWPDAASLLIALGDQPLLGSGIIEELTKRFRVETERASQVKIVAPKFRGEAGTPVLFSTELVPELLRITGDRGARSVVDRDATRVAYVDFDRPAPPDIDSAADLAAFQAELRYR
jgi:molybdenum cofactor cytidylyltransferase